MDPNNAMYPIAYALLEIENKETWTWFSELLIEDVAIMRNNCIVLSMTNKNGGSMRWRSICLE